WLKGYSTSANISTEIQLFLYFQIAHVIRMIISIAKGTESFRVDNMNFCSASSRKAASKKDDNIISHIHLHTRLIQGIDSYCRNCGGALTKEHHFDPSHRFGLEK
ncbi:hypothetical protein ACJX0J_016841, partial [Zea mays]